MSPVRNMIFVERVGTYVLQSGLFQQERLVFHRNVGAAPLADKAFL